MSTIRLHRIYYPVTTLGPGRRLGIWVQGCGRQCDGCLSPEMQPHIGTPIPLERIFEQIPSDLCPEGLTISGGEPFDQPQAVYEIICWFLSKYGSDILIYTGYTLAELQARRDSATNLVLSHVAAVVDGPYKKQYDFGRGWMGSENQTLHVFRHAERYRDFRTAPRSLQAIQEKERLLFIGIPPHNL